MVNDLNGCLKLFSFREPCFSYSSYIQFLFSLDLLNTIKGNEKQLYLKAFLSL